MRSPRGGVALAYFVVLLVGCLGLSGCVNGHELHDNAEPFHSADGKHLCVATDLPAPGFWQGPALEDRSPTGGFEYELARQLAQRLGLSGVRVVNATREQLNRGVPAGCDISLAQTDVTKQREERMSFGAPYYDANLGVLTKKGHDIPDLYTARSQVWGAEKGSRDADFVRNTIAPDKPLRTFANLGESVKALESGRIDAVLTDLPLALIEAGSRKNLSVPAQFVTGDVYAAPVRDSDNLEAVNVALRGLMADGTVADLASKWLDPRFSRPPSDVPAIAFGGT
jgi:polar amino acid transport system substrate-binding protein